MSCASMQPTAGSWLARARRCQKTRGRLPNLIAVDFYATGDLMRVVRTLNGVEPDSATATPK